MTTNTNISRRTYLLDAEGEFSPSIVLVVREADGEIRLTRVEGDHRDAERREELIESMGAEVLMRIEGEHDWAGNASAWVRY